MKTFTSFLFFFSTATVLSFSLFSCSSEQPEQKRAFMVDVELSGNLAMLSSDTLIITNGSYGGDEFKVSAAIFEGGLQFRSDSVIFPCFLTLMGRNDINELRPICSFYYENEAVSIEVDMRDPNPEVIVHGGISESLFQKRKAFSDSLRKVYRVDSIRKFYNEHHDILTRERMTFLYDTLNKMVLDYSCSLAEANPATDYAMEVFCIENSRMPLERAKKQMNALMAAGKYNNYGRFMKSAAIVMDRVAQDEMFVSSVDEPLHSIE